MAAPVLSGTLNRPEYKDALQSFQNIMGQYNGYWQDTADSVLTNFFNYMSQQEANQHEIDMWNMQNDYNSPEKQVQRIIAAGLNPSMAYGSVSTGNASSAPGTHAATYHMTPHKDKMETISNFLGDLRQVFGMVGDTIGAIDRVNKLPMSHEAGFVSGLRERVMRGDFELASPVSKDQLGDRLGVPVGDGKYMPYELALAFPEYLKLAGLSRVSNSEDGYVRGVNASADLREKQKRASELVKQIMHSIFSEEENSPADFRSTVEAILELIIIQGLNRY